MWKSISFENMNAESYDSHISSICKEAEWPGDLGLQGYALPQRPTQAIQTYSLMMRRSFEALTHRRPRAVKFEAVDGRSGAITRCRPLHSDA